VSIKTICPQVTQTNAMKDSLDRISARGLRKRIFISGARFDIEWLGWRSPGNCDRNVETNLKKPGLGGGFSRGQGTKAAGLVGATTLRPGHPPILSSAAPTGGSHRGRLREER
jgi:hypothetical protein